MTEQKELNQNKADDNKIKVKSWEDVESPNFFRFEKIREKIQGTILSKDVSARYGFGLYSMKTLDGQQIRFHGSSQLDDLLEAVDIPAIVEIEYVDNQETPNGSMKLFAVRKAVI